MSQHSETTANAPSEPKLCQMGCGFFGSDATGNCCSKCWNEKQKKEEAAQVVKKPVLDVVQEQERAPMEVDTPVTAIEEKPTEVPVPKKRKKKKATYKNMMANMMEGGPKDIEQQKEKLREVTGGGTFSKVEKI